MDAPSPQRPGESEEIKQLRAQVRLLSQAKDRQRELYLRTPAMLHSCGFQGRVVNVSDRWLEVLGYQRHEVLGRLESEFFSEASRRDYLTRHLPRFREEGRLDDVPLTMLRKDGGAVQVLFSTVAEEGPAGEPSGWLAVLRDVTRQVEAERALEETRQRLRGIFENSSVPMGMSDLDGRWLEVNPALCQLLGFTRQEFLAGNNLSMIHPEDRERISREVGRLIKGELESLRVNQRYLHKSGRPVWVEMYVNPVRGPDRRVTHLVGAGVDITESKRTREALAASEAQMRAILNGITSNIAFVNPEMEILWANQAAAASLGLTPAQMRGRTCHSLWADPSQPCPDCPSVQALQEGRSVHRIMRTPDGRIWDERGEPVFDDQGRIRGVVEIAHDITEQKQAEEALAVSQARFRELVESIREVFWVRDPHTGQMEYISPAAEEIFGQTREYMYSHPLGILELALPVDRPLVERALADQRLRGMDTDIEYRIQRPDGSMRWIRSRSVCTCDAQGRVERVLGVAEDVTERKQAQLALAKSQEKFALVFKDSPLWMTITTLEDGVFIDVNDAFCEISGYSGARCWGAPPRRSACGATPSSAARWCVWSGSTACSGTSRSSTSSKAGRSATPCGRPSPWSWTAASASSRPSGTSPAASWPRLPCARPTPPWSWPKRRPNWVTGPLIPRPRRPSGPRSCFGSWAGTRPWARPPTRSRSGCSTPRIGPAS